MIKRIDSYDAYCFDLDGTIYAADRLLPGAAETIRALRGRGKKLLFLTNSSVLTREQCRRKLEAMGVPCREDEVLTALYVSGLYFSRVAPNAKVLLLGEAAMRSQMDEFGVEWTVDPDAATHVLVGSDREFTYEKLRLGMEAVRAGARLIAVNPDPACPVPGGHIPDTWAFMQAVSAAAEVRGEHYVGKPSTFFARYALEWLRLPPDRCLIVGDRLETDIAMGLRSGMRTALVLTGIATLEDAKRQSFEPDYVIDELPELLCEEGTTAGAAGETI